MTTVTIAPRLHARIEAEEAAQVLADRSDAISQLASVNAELAATIPPLDSAIAKAEAEHARVKVQAEQMLKATAEKLNTARAIRQRADYTLSRRRDGLEAQLTGVLQHPAIRDALAEVEAIREQHRHIVRDDDMVVEIRSESEGGRIRLVPANGGLTRTQVMTSWCSTVRRQLLDLQFVAIADVKASVQAIMATKP